MNAIEVMFAQPRILYSDIKTICGIGISGVRDLPILMWHARTIMYNDFPYHLEPSDENLIKEYEITPIPPGTKNKPTNYMIDRRIVLSYIIAAGEPKPEEDKKKYKLVLQFLSKCARSAWIPEQQPIPLIETKIQPILGNVALGKSTPNEPGIPGSSGTLFPDAENDRSETKYAENEVFSASGKSVPDEPGIPGSFGVDFPKQENELYFPVKSGITRSCKQISEFLTLRLQENILDLKRDALISVNDLITATGLTTRDVRVEHWLDNEGGEGGYIEAVMRWTGKPYEEVYKSTRGRHAGTWVNMYIAFDIARWMCKDFGIMVYDIVMKVMHGDLSLIPQLVERYDQIKGTVTNLGIVAPGNSTQQYEAVVTSAETKTMSPAQVTAQVELNNSVAAFNHKLMRLVDASNPLPQATLYYINPETKLREIDKNAVDTTNVERALATLYPSMFQDDKTPSLHSMVESMWRQMVDLQNMINRGLPDAQIDKRLREIKAEKERMHVVEDLSLPAEVILQEELKELDRRDNVREDQLEGYKRMVADLSAHITQLRAAHNLAPLIGQLVKPRAKKTRGSRAESEEFGGHIPNYMNQGADDNSENIQQLHDLLAGMLEAPAPGTINELNWWMTTKIGVNFDEHIGFRNAIKVIHDIHRILTADLSAGEFNPRVQPIFGHVFHDQYARDVEDQSPNYYHELAAANIGLHFRDDRNSEFGDCDETKSECSNFTSTSSLPSSVDPCDPHATVAFHLGTSIRSDNTGKKLKSKSSTIGRGQIIDRIGDLSDTQKSAITRALDDLASGIGPNVAKPIDVHTLNIYIGQEGYALRVTPRITSSIARLCAVFTTGNILDAGAWHLRPGGQITLKIPLTGEAALGLLLRASIPGSKSIGPTMFMLTRDYVSDNNAILPDMIRAIVDALGKDRVTSIVYPQDQFGQTWRVATPGSFAR